MKNKVDSLLYFLLVMQVKKLIVLDPKKRLTTLQALQHPWVTGKAINFAHMDNAQKKLQEFNARRKLKASLCSQSLFRLWKHAIKLVALQKPCTFLRTTFHGVKEAFHLRCLMKTEEVWSWISQWLKPNKQKCVKLMENSVYTDRTAEDIHGFHKVLTFHLFFIFSFLASFHPSVLYFCASLEYWPERTTYWVIS